MFTLKIVTVAKLLWLSSVTIGTYLMNHWIGFEDAWIATGGAFAVTLALIYMLTKAQEESDAFHSEEEKKKHVVN